MFGSIYTVVKIRQFDDACFLYTSFKTSYIHKKHKVTFTKSTKSLKKFMCPTVVLDLLGDWPQCLFFSTNQNRAFWPSPYIIRRIFADQKQHGENKTSITSVKNFTKNTFNSFFATYFVLFRLNLASCG